MEKQTVNSEQRTVNSQTRWIENRESNVSGLQHQDLNMNPQITQLCKL
jgi:hypothetical protein